MNRSISHAATLLLLFLLVFTQRSEAQNWNTITDYDHNYIIKFPEIPLEVFKNVPEGLKITTYAQSAACTYMIKVLVMKAEAKKPVEMAKKTLKASTTKLGGNVIEEEEWKLGESIGIIGIIDVPDKGEGKPQIKMLCNVIVVGKIQYQLIIMGPAELFEDAVAEYFLKSFRFL